MQSETCFLELKNISKSFAGVPALRNVSLQIRKGEVHALCGENGAGKSTLIKILSGVYQPDNGDILIQGQKIKNVTPQSANKMGIYAVYQENALVGTLSVAENIYLACASVYYGLALLSSDGYDIFITNFQWFGSYRFFDVVPIQTVLYVTLAIIMALVMRYTTFGRSIYAVGGNAEAAYVSGINVKLHKLLAYIICGMLCSISAMIILSKLSGANATMASGYDMDSITACVVGGISLIGGRGDIFGCFLGVLLMGVISNALNIMAVPVFYQEIISGCVLLMAVILRSNPDYKKIIKRIRSFVAAKSLKSE